MVQRRVRLLIGFSAVWASVVTVLMVAAAPAVLAGQLGLAPKPAPTQEELSRSTPAAVTTDPAPDKAHPAGFVELTVPSHGARMNGIFYLAAGEGDHPTVILLHGFPGNEQNLDLAQSVRRAGWNVLYFHYRGSWGSPGSFTFSNAMDDAKSAIDWVRGKNVAAKYHIDSSRIVLIGHSMGGAIASYNGAHDAGVAGVVMISAVNLGTLNHTFNNDHAKIAADMAPDLPPLGGVTADTLIADVEAHHEAWNSVDYAADLKTRPVLVITSDDGLAGDGDEFVAALKKAGSVKVATAHLATDHAYSGQRIALQTIVLNWMAHYWPQASR
jgi:uncharacterized protein